MKKVGYLLVLLCGLFYSCTETEEINDSVIGKTYFPLNIGEYRIYNVVDKRWLDDSLVDSSAFQLRERVDTIFYNQAGELSYKIIRSKRNNPNALWVDDSVITVTSANNQLKRHTNNQTLIKMVFPVVENKSWSPNLYNTIDSDTLDGTIKPKPQRSYYTAVGQSSDIGGNHYPKTVKVVVNNEESFINVDKREEIYADNIGLALLHYKVLNYCTIQPCNGNQTDYDYIQTGFERIETLESYGKTE